MKNILQLDITEKHFLPEFFDHLMFKIPVMPPGSLDDFPALPIISVERHLTPDDIKSKYYPALAPSSRGFLSETVARAKETCIKKDIALMAKLVDSYFRFELANFNVDPGKLPDNLMQIIETDITMIDLSPGDTEIHYRIFTKRGLALWDKNSGEFKQWEKK